MNSKRITLNIINGVITTILILLTIFSFAFMMFRIVYFSIPVEGFSMQPTLNSTVEREDIKGDIAYVNKFKEYQINDIVVAEVKWHKLGPIIKRVIAKENDTIEIKPNGDNYQVIVNDKVLITKPINSINSIVYTNYTKFVSNSILGLDVSKNIKDNKIILNKGEVFLMGDNWGVSSDCMQHGVVKTSEVLGKVDFVVPYKQNKYGYIFKNVLLALFSVNSSQ